MDKIYAGEGYASAAAHPGSQMLNRGLGTAIERPILETVHSQLTEQNERLANLVSKVCEFSDRLLGQRPENQGKAVAPVRAGLTGNIEDQIDRLTSLVGWFESEVSRLGRIA